MRARERYGANILSAPTPRFVDLYIEQLSPLAIFQIFCSLLWLLDAVSIGFTVFQLFTILLLESTTVFQRQRTLKTLSSMSAKPYEARLPPGRVGQALHHPAPPGRPHLRQGRQARRRHRRHARRRRQAAAAAAAPRPPPARRRRRRRPCWVRRWCRATA